MPVWQGELYFEMHRGTLTSQVMTKVGNRRNERLLHEAELWWTMLGWPDEVASELDRLWKDLLVQQFHDILPGSSIAWVHADAEAEHARITERLEKLIAAGLACLAPGPVAVASARSRARTEVVVAPVTPSGPGPVQQLAGGGCAFLTPVPAMGVVPAERRRARGGQRGRGVRSEPVERLSGGGVGRRRGAGLGPVAGARP